MHLILALLLSAYSWADGALEITHNTAVYQATNEGARVLFNVEPGDEVSAVPAHDQNFWRVRVQRNGKWVGGYIRKSDLEDELTEPAVGASGKKTWGFGAGVIYTYYLQKGKSFQTDDQVTYTTTDYTSTMISPALVMQMDQRDFWRLTIAEKKTHFKATATEDVVGTQPQPIDLQQTFLSALLQKAWTMPSVPRLYYGLGVEASKATSVALQLGTRTLPTGSSDEPLYIGAQGFAGGTWSVGQSLSIYGELRFEYVMNQSPGILGAEGAVGLLYWP